MLDDIEDTYDDIVTIFDSIGSFVEFLLEPESWIRIFEVLLGLVLIWGALNFGNR